MSENLTFCDKLRKSTREIHAISDALVNTKLALGLHNDKVWADGLLVFYEVFKFLESAISNGEISELDCFTELLELQRTKAFEDDLTYYLGPNWLKNYSPRLCVVKYLKHLEDLQETNPILLTAYIYHLYMGLLSGGQILKRKRQLIQKIIPFRNEKNDGNHVTNFNNKNIYNVKTKIRKAMNELAESLDSVTQEQIIAEGKVVFKLNNEIIRSVKGAGMVILQKTMIIIVICTTIFLIFNYIRLP